MAALAAIKVVVLVASPRGIIRRLAEPHGAGHSDPVGLRLGRDSSVRYSSSYLHPQCARLGLQPPQPARGNRASQCLVIDRSGFLEEGRAAVRTHRLASRLNPGATVHERRRQQPVQRVLAAPGDVSRSLSSEGRLAGPLRRPTFCRFQDATAASSTESVLRSGCGSRSCGRPSVQ